MAVYALNEFEKRIDYIYGGCSLWTGGTYGNSPYGRFRPFNLISISAHRFSFIINDGEGGPMVLHKCNTKLCVRFDHLYGGSQSDNMFDYWEMKRWSKSVNG
jgi:hypothetical protein